LRPRSRRPPSRRRPRAASARASRPALRLPRSRVDHTLLDERVAAVQHLLGGLVVAVVVVRPELGEERVDAPASLAAEDIGELDRLLAALGALLRHGLRVDARSGDREQLGADVDDTPQERLLLLHLRLPAA